MKTVISVIKTAAICFFAYKSLYYSFLFLVSGMWIITVLLLILFGYLCNSLFTEVLKMSKQFKSYQQLRALRDQHKEKTSAETASNFSSETA